MDVITIAIALNFATFPPGYIATGGKACLAKALA
jgi:hypothetical protein